MFCNFYACNFLLNFFQNRDDIARLIQCIVHFVHSKDQDLAFKASLSLGHLCVVNSDARDHLLARLHDSSFSIRMKVSLLPIHLYQRSSIQVFVSAKVGFFRLTATVQIHYVWQIDKSTIK